LVGAPYAPTNLTLEQRRQFVLSRLYIGAFTRSLRRQIIEQFILPTLGGPATLFDPSGIPLTPAGATLFSGASGDVNQYYRVYEDVRNFAYEVRVLNTLGIDKPGLVRELRRITPAGINPADMTTSVVEDPQILDYTKATRDTAPNAWYKLDNVADSSGYGVNGAVNGGLVAGNLGSPGLLNVAVLGVHGATDFDGVDDYISIPHNQMNDLGDVFTIEAWVRPDAIGSAMTIVNKGITGISGPPGPYWLYVSATGAVTLAEAWNLQSAAHSSINLAAGQTYHIMVTKDRATPKIYINGVDRTVVDAHATDVFAKTTATVNIGRRVDVATMFFNGVIQGLTMHPFVLSAATALAKYKTGINQTI
jgi:hypothetical protein